jgi:quercetin dioxygenase-like cupin family protein
MRFYTYVGFALGFLTLSIAVSGAHDQKVVNLQEEKITQLLKKALSDVPGRNVVFITVDYLPGQATKPHKHPGPAVAYVAEGSVISQLEGEEPITYHKGEFWYEPPYVGHLVSKNASNTQSAKLIVWLLLGDQDPIMSCCPYPPALLSVIHDRDNC